MKGIYIVFLISLLSSCAANVKFSENNRYSLTYQGVEKGTRIFVVPVAENFDEFAGGGKVVFEAIEQQLEQDGWSVVTISQEDAAIFLDQIVTKVGGVYSPKTGKIDSEKSELVMAEFIDLIPEPERFSAVLFPSLVSTYAELGGRYAHWDGVKRRIESTGYGLGNTTWSGSTIALSVSIMAYDLSKRWLFTSYGGLALPHKAVINRASSKSILRDDIFQREDEIESGVRVSLLPILEHQLIK